MRYYIKNIGREFSPKEAAEICNVSTALQRDWRRRKILPERKSDGWSAFELSDIIRMITIKNLSTCGFSLEAAKEIASLSIWPVFTYLAAFDVNYEFDGVELPDEQKKRIRSPSTGKRTGRFLKVPLPASETAFLNVTRADDLNDLFGPLGESPYALTIDNYALGDSIMIAVKGPLFRIEAEEITEE